MKRLIKGKKGWIFVLLIGIAATSYGQQNNKENTTSETVRHFKSLFRADPRLVSGEYYRTPLMSEATGHPFCIDGNWKTGYVMLNGIRFDSLPMRYDISTHVLVLNTVDLTDSYMQIKLKKNRVSEFTLGDRLFKVYPSDDPMHGRRFYESMVDGTLELMVLRSKNLKVTAGGINDYIYQQNRMMYLNTADGQVNYRGKRTLYHLFPNLKPALKAYAKEKKLRFRKLDEWDHALLVGYCNILLKQADEKNLP